MMDRSNKEKRKHMERRNYISLAYWARDRHEEIERALADSAAIVNITDAFKGIRLVAKIDSAAPGPEMPEAA